MLRAIGQISAVAAVKATLDHSWVKAMREKIGFAIAGTTLEEHVMQHGPKPWDVLLTELRDVRDELLAAIKNTPERLP